MQAYLLRYVHSSSYHLYQYHHLHSYGIVINIMAYQVLNKALKAPAHLQYQLAFLSTVTTLQTKHKPPKLITILVQELIKIYNGSSPSREIKPEENTAGKRKPIEGDCPVCFMEFEADKEDIVWCRGSCGNNIHKVCFDKWAATQREHGFRCVYW